MSCYISSMPHLHINILTVTIHPCNLYHILTICTHTEHISKHHSLHLSTPFSSTGITMTSNLSQSPSEVFMVRPGNFMFNTETAVTNHYQDTARSNMEWQEVAMQEFDRAVDTLRENKVKVTVFQDTENPVKPGKLLIILHYLMLIPRCHLPQQLDLLPPDGGGGALPYGHAQPEVGEEDGRGPVAEGQLLSDQSGGPLFL